MRGYKLKNYRTSRIYKNYSSLIDKILIMPVGTEERVAFSNPREARNFRWLLYGFLDGFYRANSTLTRDIVCRVVENELVVARVSPSYSTEPIE